MKALKQFLKNYGFNGNNLEKIPFESLQCFFRILFNEVQSKNAQLFSQSQRTNRIDQILLVIQRQEQSIGLCMVLRKIGIIYMLTRKYIEKQRLDEKMVFYFQNKVRSILNNDIKSLMQYKQKKVSSLGRISDFIRQLSGEKQKKHKSRSKLQNFTEKGTLKEIVSKIIQPFCNYLLKIMQNSQEYLIIFHPEFIRKGQSTWKMINWSHQLTDITSQLYRLGKYFKDDFRPILVFVTYLCSKDISIFYDLIKGSIQRVSTECFAQIDRICSQKLTEVKRQIEEMINIKEKINFIFGNNDLKNYMSHFQRPKRYKYSDETQTKQVQFLLSHHQNKSTKNTQTSQIQQTISSFFLGSAEDFNDEMQQRYKKNKNQEEIVQNYCKLKDDLIGCQVRRSILGTRVVRPVQKTYRLQKQNKISNLRKDKKITLVQ